MQSSILDKFLEHVGGKVLEAQGTELCLRTWSGRTPIREERRSVATAFRSLEWRSLEWRCMLMLTSSEFIALSRAQIILLTQALGASLSVVYLTQGLADGAETQLIPIMAYPDAAINWQPQDAPRSLMSARGTNALPQLLSGSHLTLPQTGQPSDTAPPPPVAPLPEAASEWLKTENRSPNADSNHPDRAALIAARRVVLPLMHEDAVLGLLVTERNDRPWTEWEQTQIHQIADTLAIACVLDQRYQWLKQDNRQQQLQAQQHDVLDNLLHQFRNSLTALQTFGKLILKRLQPEDSNREIAASLVRETARLRDLAQQLELAVAEPDTVALPPLALPPAMSERTVLSDRPADVSNTLDLKDGSKDRNKDRSRDAHQVLSDRLADPNTTLPPDKQLLPLLPAAGLLPGAPLALAPCAIATVLEPLLASASAIAQDRSLTLYTDIPAVPLVQADAQMLREVLSNAIDNALKYTPAGGLVFIQASVGNVKGQTADERQQVAEIAITDTGPGIPAQDLLHLFERRYRGVQAQTDIPGSGLGLAIAHALVTQMQGEIDVFSPARTSYVQQHLTSGMRQHVTSGMTTPGRGTTVVVRLAVASPALSPPTTSS